MGCPNVDAMLSSMTSRQFVEWQQYFDLANLGENPEDRADIRAGIIAATVANYSGNRRQGAAPAKPQDFAPTFQRADEAPDLYSAMSANAIPERRPATRTPPVDPEPSSTP